MPTVSVVMPAFNSQRDIRAAIDSIRTQTFADWELLVVDDGSTDNTVAIVQTYADSRIRLIQHSTNQGVAVAHNTALSHARGQYIATQDSDDVAEPDRLARQVAFLDAHPDIAVVGSAVTRTDTKGATLDVKTYPERHGLIVWSLLFFNPIAHPTVMQRRETCAAYPEDAPSAEDYRAWSDLSQTHRLHNLPDPLVRFRCSGTNVSATRAAEQEREATRVVADLLQRAGLDDLAVAPILRALSRDRSALTIDDLRRAAKTIRAAWPVYHAGFPDGSIRHDASIRLCVIAAERLRRLDIAGSLATLWDAHRASPAALAVTLAHAAKKSGVNTRSSTAA